MKYFLTTLLLLASTSRAASSFELLKTLAGNWTVIETNEGEPGAEVRFELHANDSTLVEFFGGMVTVYHADKNRLMATHYCSAGNQPRMVTADNVDPASKTLEFKFLDVSNYIDSQNGHISDVTIEFLAPDMIRETWIYTNRSGEKFPAIFKLKKQ